MGIDGVCEDERTGNKAPVKIKWLVGSVSGAGKGNRKTRKHGPGGKAGRLRRKSGPGFQIGVRW